MVIEVNTVTYRRKPSVDEIGATRLSLTKLSSTRADNIEDDDLFIFSRAAFHFSEKGSVRSVANAVKSARVFGPLYRTALPEAGHREPGGLLK